MSDVIAQSFTTLNYSGMLFNKGNTKTPFSTLIGGRPKETNSVEFVCGQEYTTGGGAQPSISETDSLTAPESTITTRSQLTNVTQIFQESLYVSDAHNSNMGTLSGANIAGQVANPVSELDFQTAAKMAKIARDIEYTFLRGAYVKAANDATANQSRGMSTAITSNVVTLDSQAVTFWDIVKAMQLIYNANAPLDNLVALVDAVTLLQLNADALANGLTKVENGRTYNGIAVKTFLTPFGEVGVQLVSDLAAGTMLIVNPMVCSPVFQPVPKKGLFYREELGKSGAGEKYHIFGQVGLDHGPEWCHAKITGMATTFTAPPSGKKIYTAPGMPIETASVLPVIETVTLGAVTAGTQTGALEITYIGDLASAATLAYEWQNSATENGTYTAISGATSATYTPASPGQAGKYIRVKVTASGTATGFAYSNKVLCAAAG